MKKHHFLIAIIIVVIVFGMLIWRFQKLSVLNVISIDAALISDVSAGAMITDFKSGEISTYLLDDAERADQKVKEILKILDGSEYQRDCRNLLPWGVRSVSSDKNYDGRTLIVSFSDGSRAVQLHLMSCSLMLVSSSEKTNMYIYHPVNKNTFNELIEYIQTYGMK